MSTITDTMGALRRYWRRWREEWRPRLTATTLSHLSVAALLACAGCRKSQVIGEAVPDAGPTAAAAIRFSTGISGLPLIMDAWPSPVAPDTSSYFWPLETYLETTPSLQVDALEDYIGWGVVEPEQDTWRWDIYRERARQIKAAGLRYIPFIWTSNLPQWVKSDPSSYPRVRCIEHNEYTDYLSV